ncbi:MAG: type II toxin-antitoxin system RelE/ParE family toxin [Ardenticatenaceae bacterium]|nr:type II toxin-antitoxin system RelE/ParE family toxin [Ardenticatenaceae bacterium]HBY93378.1 hypothetical protein [Chloroflexota bacterium]
MARHSGAATEFVFDTRNVKRYDSPPSNRLEALSRDRKGQYSIRINRQWRSIFSIIRG